MSYSDVLIPDRLRELEIEHHESIKGVAQVNYLWDNMMIYYILNDILYSASVQLITAEETALLKASLHEFLIYTEKLASIGHFPETGNAVSFYISPVNFDTGYSYLEVEDIKMSMIRVFVVNMINSFDEVAFERLQAWTKSTKRLSMLISDSNEHFRMDFFKKQHELIDTMQQHSNF
jgi:hypothetical protein